MANIKILSTDLINKIAAGEVVERPVSVVKELVENAIDAKASFVTVEIKDGGISLIRVTDNGIGIEKDEVKTAFLKHATSKIGNIDDLENVMSLGFRGEALSSIASVAQVEILTKTKNSDIGFYFEIDRGEFITERDVAAADGTAISVNNLFYNIPARRKFLKKTATESGYISDVITKIALGNPHIAFNYINNGSSLIRTNGENDLKSAIYQIYGKETALSLMPINYSKEDIHVTGYICKPEMYRSNRSYEHMFINGRHIKSDIISSAAEQALKTMLPIGKFPVFFLFVKIIPSLIDINVHPTKLEVRFWNDEEIFAIVSSAVKKAVSGHNLIPEIGWRKDEQAEHRPLNSSRVAESALSFTLKPADSKQEEIVDIVYANKSTVYNTPVFEKSYSETYEQQEEIATYNQAVVIEKETSNLNHTFLFADYKIVGQIFDTYWVMEQGSKMYIMDQHAAHERYLYDQITNSLEKSASIISQPILNPAVLSVTPKEMAIIEQNWELLEKFGFDIDKFGEKEIAIRAVPYLLKNAEDVSFFLEIVDKLSKVETSISNIYDIKADAIAMAACKAAVKGNDKLSSLEAKELIDKIVKLDNPFTCPHGRPTVIEISKYELEKKFKRVM